MAGRPRRPDGATVRGAVLAQWYRLVNAVDELDPAVVNAPAGIGGWTVSELVHHLARTASTVTDALTEPAPRKAELDTVAFLLASMAAGGHVASRTRARDAELTPAQVIANLDEAVETATRVLTGLGARADSRVVRTRFGPLRLTDLLVTRLVEAVVHAGDLVRAAEAAGHPVESPADDEALRITVTTFVDLLAAVAPGRSVEVRVVDPARRIGVAVQCVEGPRHTRGTPPNVVEVHGAEAFVSLAAGRADWSELVRSGAVRASGSRADLRPFLPLLP